MIEAIMFFAGGFLVATLLALILISFVHQRAVRLTQQRLEDAIPVSMAEIAADRDSLRAQFAMSARRLEMSVEQLQAQVTTQSSDIARKTEAIGRLKAELADNTAVTDALAAEAKTLGAKLREAEREAEVKTEASEANERELASKEAELAKATKDLNEQRGAADTQRVEIAVLKTQVEQLRTRIGDLEQESQVAARLLSEERAAVASLTTELEEKRLAIDALRPVVARLEGEAAAYIGELENRAGRIGDLEARTGDQLRMLAAREAAYNDLRQERDTEVQALRQQRESDIAALRQQHQGEVAALDQQRQSEIADHQQRHQAEAAALHQQHEAEVAALRQELARERVEHSSDVQLLRDEINALERLLAGANDRVASHAGRIGDFEKSLAERDLLISQRDGEAKALENAIVVVKRESERLQAEKHSLERLLETASHTLETRAGRIGDLESWMAERDELLRQRDAEIKELHGKLAVYKDHDEAVAAKVRVAEETGKLETLLQAAIEDRRQAQLELATLKQEAEATWKTERAENALLRERMIDIAARVADMAIAKDKAGGGPIEAMLAQNSAREGVAEAETEAIDHATARRNGNDGAPAAGELITRIRKLRTAAPAAANPVPPATGPGRRKRAASAADNAP